MTFLYKCRACGKIERNPRVGGDDESGYYLALGKLCDAIRTPKEVALLSLHSCGDKRTGISDLIGCAPECEKTV